MKKLFTFFLLATAIGLLTVLPIHAQTLKPHGHVELAYVPERTFFEKYKNEFLATVGFGLKLSLKRLDFTIGWSQTTYANKSKRGLYFSPNTQVYDYSMGIKRHFGSRSLALFFVHQCIHPVDKDRFWIYDSKRNESFHIHATNFTQVGLRFEF